MIDLKKVDYRHYICISITIIFLLLSIFYFKYGMARIGESIYDLISCSIYYVSELFDLGLSGDLRINELTKQPFVLPFNLPNTWDEFVILWNKYWELFISKENLEGYLYFLGDILYYLSKILMIIGPIIILIINLLNRYFAEKDETIKNLLNIMVVDFKCEFKVKDFYNILSNKMNIENKKINSIYKMLKEKEYIKRRRNRLILTDKGIEYYKLLISDSKPLKVYKSIENNVFFPIKIWLIKFKNFLIVNKDYLNLWLVLWLYNFNIFTIIIEFIAYYLYFFGSFNLLSLYTQLIKLLMDLSIMIDFIPNLIWYYIIFKLLMVYRSNNGREILRKFERRIRGFINTLGLVVLICGTTGKGKTLLMTDMALSKQIMLRDEALEEIQRNKVKFPNFDWTMYDKIIIENYKNRENYKKAHIKEWVKFLRKKFEHKPISNNLFGYDVEHYSLCYFNGLYDEYIFDVLQDYAEAMLVYITKSSLILSNYPIRSDDVYIDKGKFPLYCTDFFSKDKDTKILNTKYSHILDYDIIRLGKKMVWNNEKAGAYEYGILVLDEYGKDKGNQITNREIKYNDEESNAKNELSELYLKTYRHLITINKETYGWCLLAEQRAESIGADSREIAEKIVHIREIGEMKNTLFLFQYDELIYDLINNFYKNVDIKYKSARTDNTLFMYLINKICSKIITNHQRKVMQFGYSVYKLETESSTLDNKYKEYKYYRMNGKIFDNRYKTNCFEDPYIQRSLKSSLNIDDLQEYEGINQTSEEMKQQNSRWANKLLKLLGEEEN